MMYSATFIALVGSASAQFVCPPGAVHPMQLGVGANCGGFCDMIGAFSLTSLFYVSTTS